MAAYAALVSLMNTLDLINNHTSISICFAKKQIEFLSERVSFFLDFIESHNSYRSCKEVEDLESRIASAAHAAEDAIESRVVEQLLAGSSTVDHVGTSSSLLVDLQKAIKKIQSKDEMLSLQKVMDSIMKKIMKIERKGGFKDEQPSYTPTSRSHPTGKHIVVGFDDELVRLMEVLTGSQPNRLIIPVVGMGGIGKTTLARNAYESSVIMHFFHVRAWVTVSKTYRVRDVLLELLSGLKSLEGGRVANDEQRQMNEDGIGEQLYKSLSGRRYLIVLDDIWSVEAWNEIKLFFPDNNNGSRIVVTSRLSNVAVHLGSWCLKMNFLDENRSWKLFCEKAFEDESCPLELLEIGKTIVRKCRGLPLSIVVIGGLLQKSSRTRRYWESVARDINSILNSSNDKHCVDILSLSYSHLPSYLRPCFLYMAIFPEDDEIYVSRLIKLWVSEGFIKPSRSQSLEDVAKNYLNELIERNLILVCNRGSSGRIKTCNIHDLLRDLCLRLAHKEKFLYVTRVLDNPRGIDKKRCIVFHRKGLQSPTKHALGSTSVRSLICYGFDGLSLKCRLLRVVSMNYIGALIADIFHQVNLQYLSCDISFVSYFNLPSSISLLWRVQTLILRGGKRVVAPSEIWELPQLRHLEFDELCLPDPPPCEQQDRVVLGNLQTLKKIVNFKWSENACKRIPNIKKLHANYDDLFVGLGSYYCLNNIGSLHKLESLNLLVVNLPDRVDLLRNLTFPNSLKKLSLTKCQLHWEDLTMIGSLPHLEVLKLELGSVLGPEWSPIEGEFPRLKYLKIHHSHLMTWNVESSHFPVLVCLFLDQMFKLDEIPSSIGDIATLKLIRVDYCKVSAAISAMKILEEQESLGNDGLQVRVQFWCRVEEQSSFREMLGQESFTSNNFFLSF